MNLTALAHELLAPGLTTGDLAIDATAGNGWDTAFLVRMVAPGGRVIAIDIQPAALERTRERISRLNGQASVQFVCGCHAHLAAMLPAGDRGRVKAVMFNLGYLPGGERTSVTSPRSTLPALEAAVSVLDQAGVISVLAYPGHPGGLAETRAIGAWIATCGLRVQHHSNTPDAGSPILWLLRP